MTHQTSNPYVGPRPFQRGETLYGRNHELMNLLNLIIAERIVMFYSPSGAGKTSLLQASLFPRLEKKKFRVLPVIRVNLEPPEDIDLPPSFNPYIYSALACLEYDAAFTDDFIDSAELAGMSVSEYLDRRREALGDPKKMVLIFDQFEEILTKDPANVRDKIGFFRQVGEALTDRRLWAVFSLREDYIAGLDPFLSHIPTRLNTTFRMDLLGEEAALEAVRKPALEKGREFTEGAAEKLIGDLRKVRFMKFDGATVEKQGLYVEPVQLQVVCLRLWDNLPENADRIVEADVEKIGNVDQALSDYYESCVGSISKSTDNNERRIRDWVDTQLITEQGIRGQVLKSADNTQGLDNRVIYELISKHLIRAEERRGATWFELAHDRLLEPVKNNNADWRESHLSLLQRQSDLWEKQSRPDGLLLAGDALAEAETWAKENPDFITQVEKDLLEKSKAKQETIEREKKQTRRIKWLAVAAVILMVCAMGFAYWAKMAQDRAVTQQRRAEQQEAEAKRQARLAAEQLIEARQNMGYMFNEKAERALEDKNFNAARLYALHALKNFDPNRPGSERAKTVGMVCQPDTPIIFSSRQDFSVKSVAFSSDGRTLASGSSDNTIRLWDVETGKEKAVLEGHTDHVLSVKFSPDGKTLASGSDYPDTAIRLWDVETGREKAQLAGHTKSVSSVSFSPDGKTLASGSSDDTIRLWDVETGKEKAQLAGHTNSVYSVSFSPDAKTLASGSSDNTIRLWDVETGKEKAQLAGHTREVNSVSFSPDGKTLASGSWDDTIRLWNVETGKEKALLAGHSSAVNCVSFSPEGKTLASGSGDIYSSDNTIRLWDIDTRKEKALLAGHSSAVNCVSFSPDGKTLASGSEDNTIRLWDVDTRKEKAQFARHSSDVRSESFSPDGKTLASGSEYPDTAIRLWDVETGKEKALLSGHTFSVSSVSFSPDGKTLASGSEDNTIRLWDVETGKEKSLLTGHTDRFLSVSFSPDGKTMASGSEYPDTAIRLWDVETGKEKALLSGHTFSVWIVSFSPDGKTLASGSHDKTIRLWDTETGKEKSHLSGHMASVWSVSFSPDGKTLASGLEDHTIRLWDTETGKEKMKFSGHTDYVFSVSFSLDGKTLASGSGDNTIRLWDAETGKEKTLLSGHTDSVRCVIYSPDGKTLASGSDDNTIRLWDLSFFYDIKDRQLTEEEIKAAEQKYNLYLVNLELQPIEPAKEFRPPQWPKTHPFRWLSKAEAGDAEAMVELGIIYDRDNELDKAVHWYAKAIEAGSERAKERMKIFKQWLTLHKDEHPEAYQKYCLNQE